MRGEVCCARSGPSQPPSGKLRRPTLTPTLFLPHPFQAIITQPRAPLHSRSQSCVWGGRGGVRCVRPMWAGASALLHAPPWPLRGLAPPPPYSLGDGVLGQGGGDGEAAQQQHDGLTGGGGREGRVKSGVGVG